MSGALARLRERATSHGGKVPTGTEVLEAMATDEAAAISQAAAEAKAVRDAEKADERDRRRLTEQAAQIMEASALVAPARDAVEAMAVFLRAAAERNRQIRQLQKEATRLGVALPASVPLDGAAQWSIAQALAILEDDGDQGTKLLARVASREGARFAKRVPAVAAEVSGD